MGQVFAGFVCGYILAFAGAPLLGLNLVSLRASSPLVARLMPAGTPMVPVVVVLHGGLIIVCTGAGILLGLLLYAMRGGGEALGSANIAFTLLVLGLTALLSAPVVMLAARFRGQVIATAVVVVALFGWLMPYMAEWSRFGSS